MERPNDERMTLPWYFGNVFADPDRRQRWRAFVQALDEAARPGGPLEGWAFHGTAGRHVGAILREGVTTSDVLMRDAAGQWMAQGTYWGSPVIAAWYAEDTAEGMDPPDLGFGIVAARVSDIEGSGLLVPDEASLDWPECDLLGRDARDLCTDWEASAQQWQDCFSIYGAFACLGPVGPEAVRILRTEEHLNELVAEVSVPAPTGD